MLRHTLIALLAAIVSTIPATAREVKPAGDKRQPQRWAVLIGVDDYTELGKLRFAGNDQRALAAQLIASGFPGDQVYVLHDKAEQNRYRPFRENIEKQLALVLGMADEGDLLVVGFSGHGVELEGKSYLCPANAELENSMEDVNFGHGVFMHFLLEGLKGQAADKEGTVTLARLYDYSSLETKKYVAREHNDFQTPALRGDIDGPFEICKACNAKQIANSIGMKLVLIPAGEFLMGSPDSEEDRSGDEGPQHRVRITKPFYLGQHEVTRGQFGKFVSDAGYKTEAEQDGEGGSGYDGKSWTRKPEYTWRNAGFTQTDEHPVVNVSWNDAVAFCEWLSRKEGKKYRLPSEAQWEYACRAGTTTRYHSGDDAETLAKVGNVADAAAKAKFPDWPTIAASDGYVFTAPVGNYRPNAFGVYDMHGNVWEWCADWYDRGYYGKSPVVDPPGPSGGSYRVFRGGDWGAGARFCRSAYRPDITPGSRNSYLGLRVSLVPAER